MKLKELNQILIFSLGGSLVVPEEGINISFLKKIKKIFFSFLELNSVHKIIIIVGGGKTSRDYINASKELDNIKKEEMDNLGIISTQINAELVRLSLKPKVYNKVVKEPQKLSQEIIIASGWKPGNSSDLNAVLWALKEDVNMIFNLTDVDFVYDKDPDKFSDAIPLEKLSWDNFKDIVVGNWKPGFSTPFGPIASKKAQEEGIKVVILKGKNLENLENCIKGFDFDGSVIE